MEEAIQILTAQKVRELLTLCGIGDRSDEPIKQHILGISNFGEYSAVVKRVVGVLTHIFVRETRLSAGIKDIPANERRGSYRALSSAEKRGRVDYAGMDGTSTKKRKRGKKGSNANKSPNERSPQKDSDAASPGKTEQFNTCAVGTDKPLSAGEPKVGDTALAAHGEAYPMSNSSALPEVEAERHSTLDSPSSATELVSCPDHQKEPDCPRLAAPGICPGPNLDINDAGCFSLLPSRLSSMPTLCASAVRIIEMILMNCVKLNYALAKYGRQRKNVTITTKIEDIRSYVDQITQLRYADAIYAVKKDNALFASKAMQSRYNETAYWDIIMKGAKLLDPAKLPTAMGRLDDFTTVEKHATKTFMEEAGYGTSYANQRRCRRLWRRLFEMRNAGVDRILLYRTKEFDSFCIEYPNDTEPSLVERVQQWDALYGPHIKQLENRVTKENEGDYAGKLRLSQPHVAARLDIHETSWNNSGNTWFSGAEEITFQSSGPHKASPDELGGFFGIQTAGGANRNKSIFVTLLPKDESLLSVCPIIPVQEGDMLGVFAGMIRYSENFDATYGIPGPRDKLWLDYSQVTGTLNLMRATPPDGDANVSLRWELLEEGGKQESRMMWRVSVRAVRAINAFEELVRAAPQKEQYLLHQSPAHAQRGFTK
ncbi:hypothetical protein AnigIFM50267_002907 [Aspergillus niger]|nr:hypothetical protein AnigIFM50267_002907 [Aspergillus niger]